jgi:hypothetical protein
MSRGNVNGSGSSGSNRQASGLRMLALAAAMVGGTACTDANESLVILQAQRPDEMCVINDGIQGSIRHDRGTLDVALDKPYGYQLFPLVVNNLQPIAAEGEIEPNRVSVMGAQVKLMPPPGVTIPFSDACGAEFDTVGQAQMGPGETRALGVEVVRSCHSAMIRGLFASGRLNSNTAEKIDFRVIVRIKGRHGGTRILSDPFEFPIRICYGCLQEGFQGPFSAFNFPQPVPACDKLTTNPYPGNPCPGLIAQDIGPVLCCARNNDPNNLQCPASPTVTAPTTP